MKVNLLKIKYMAAAPIIPTAMIIMMSLILVPTANPESIKKHSVGKASEKMEPAPPAAAAINLPVKTIIAPDIVSPDTLPKPSMQFGLDWTQCQIHRVDSDSIIVLLLDGNISASQGIIWTLSTIEPLPGEPPFLYYVEGVIENQYPVGAFSVPLTYELSVDGGGFDLIEIQEDNTLQVIFPPGDHIFQVRITGIPDYGQHSGYYKLQLGQSLLPQM